MQSVWIVNTFWWTDVYHQFEYRYLCIVYIAIVYYKRLSSAWRNIVLIEKTYVRY